MRKVQLELWTEIALSLEIRVLKLFGFGPL